MVKNLSLVFDRLKCAGLKLKPKKCILFKDINKFLGHTVSTEGISTRPDKIKAIQEWKVLTNVQDVRSFIDLCSYSRIFVREFATIAKLLHDLTANDESFK